MNGQFEILNYFPCVGEKEDTCQLLGYKTIPQKWTQAVHFWGMIRARENTPFLGTKHTPKVVYQCVHFWGIVSNRKSGNPVCPLSETGGSSLKKRLTKFQIPVQVLVQ